MFSLILCSGSQKAGIKVLARLGFYPEAKRKKLLPSSFLLLVEFDSLCLGD